MEKIIRLYTTDYAKSKVRKLSARATQCFSWIYSTLEFDENDHYFFDRALYMKEANIKSTTTVSAAIKELLLAGIITNTTKNSHYTVDKKVMDVGTEEDYKEHEVYKQLTSLYAMLSQMKVIYTQMTQFDLETEEEEQQLLEVEAKIKECEEQIRKLEASV